VGYQSEVKQDLRLFERIPNSLELRMINLDTNRVLLATARDASAQGLGIISQEEIRPGDNLGLWLSMPDKKEPLYVLGSVVWAKQQENNEFRGGVALSKPNLMGMSRIFRV